MQINVNTQVIWNLDRYYNKPLYDRMEYTIDSLYVRIVENFPL